VEHTTHPIYSYSIVATTSTLTHNEFWYRSNQDTFEELLKGAGIKMPSNQFGTFKQAQRVQQGISPEQAELELYTGEIGS